MALLKKMLPPERREDLQVVDLEVQRLIQLTNKVSDFLRNPLGTPETIDFPPFIGTIAQRFPIQIAFSPKSLEHVSIDFDADRARSVFENLLKNAMESCQGRDPQVEVEIRLDKRDQVHVYVRDRGDGIPEGDEKKIFDPFFTTKIHGSGIGLSISRQFVKAREEISASTREKGGAPWPRSSCRGRCTGCATRRDTATARKKVEHMKILIVDDEPNIRELMRKYLDWKGSKVTVRKMVFQPSGCLRRLRTMPV
jgi:hypothetical protein